MQLVYAQEPLPQQATSSIFLAGPTPRSLSVPSWRPLAIALLESAGYDGTVFIPEPRGGAWQDYMGQIAWESDALNRSDSILFWIPRDLTPDEYGYPRMGALTTNDEWGTWKTSGKVVLGTPPVTRELHVGYQLYFAKKYEVPTFTALDDTIQAAMKMVTPGAPRVGAECMVPLHVWRTHSFQGWYQALKSAGNRLDQARVIWTLNIDQEPILWALNADVHVTAENRNLSEVVVGRPDTSTVVLWSRAATMRETEIVLVKEFRAAVRTSDGFVHALPGGSSKEHGSPLQTALDELREETGLTMPAGRMVSHVPRQVAASISSFTSTCFAAEISREEMDRAKALRNSVHGIAADGERTYLEVTTVGELLDKPLTDWMTLGMVFSALARATR
jgi:8-oxo-dGTP pyrophosphatase MutT (NUDIX family)